MAMAGLPPVSKRLFDAIVGFCFEDFLCWYAPLTVILWFLISWADTMVPTMERWSIQETRALSAHVTTFVWSWFLVAIYHYLNGCEWTKKYRILVGESGDALRKDHGLPRHVEKLTFWDILPNCFRNQVIYFVGSYLACAYFAERLALIGSPSWGEAGSCPSLGRMLIEMAALQLLFDLVLGIDHYILHHSLYAYHKQHHQTKGDSPVSGWYMTLIDLGLQLLIPIFAPPFLLGVSWMTFTAWLLMVEWDGVHSHAAYDFGWPMPSSRRHFLHHALSTCNYSNGIFDALMGTEALKLHDECDQSQDNPQDADADVVLPTLLTARHFSKNSAKPEKI
jgi:sterol desaturase/sphingolipid hydroxylase (fatty acid hydroxylase superfamily)